MNKLIICTTAICRIEIHNQAFNNYINKLKNIENYEINWFINIDNPDVCYDNVKDTNENFKNLLKNIKYEIIISKNPSFVQAYYVLLKKIKNIIKEGDIILWLEDDWIFTENFNINELVNNIFKNNTNILFQLNYNKIGSFPPFMMDYVLFKKYYEIALLLKKTINPENISRHVYRHLIKTDKINYLNLLSNEEYNNICKKNIDINKFIYEETYLKIDISNTYILINTYNYIENKEYKNINLINYENFKNLEGIKFIRRGIDLFYKKNNYSYVNDIGRFWLKSNNIQRNYKEFNGNIKKNVILSIYYTTYKDPQRNKYIECDNFNKISKLYNSVIKNNLNLIIFYDNLSEEFINKYSNENVKFILFMPILEKIKCFNLSSMNDIRFLIYLDYIIENKLLYEKVLLIDLFDEEINHDPFKLFTTENLYVSYDRKRDFNHYYIKDRILKTYGKLDNFSDISNNNIITSCFGGNIDIIFSFLKKIETEFSYNIIDPNYNNNYIVFNYVAYKYFINNIVFSKDGETIITKCGTEIKKFTW